MPAREIEILAQPATNPRAGTITAPFQFLVDGADNLRIEGWNSVAGVALELTFRFANVDGSIEPQRYTLPLTADRQSTGLDISLAPGYLLNMAVFASGGAPKIGQTFVCIKLIRGFGGATIVMGLLLQGYVTAEQGLGWPGSPIASSTDSEPALRVITGTAPAAGAEITETVPTGARWELVSLGATHQGDGSGANRTARLLFLSGAAVMAAFPQAFLEGVGNLQGYCWTQGLPLSAGLAGDRQVQGLVTQVALPQGAQIRTSTIGLGPADQWSAPTYLVREWLEVDT